MKETDFWNQFTITENGCWKWTRHTLAHGYGQVRYQGRLQQAHRVAWILSHGLIPDGLFVCHHCDNPPCIKPDHLFLGTHTDNMRDCSQKGRFTLYRQQGKQRRNCKIKLDNTLNKLP